MSSIYVTIDDLCTDKGPLNPSQATAKICEKYRFVDHMNQDASSMVIANGVLLIAADAENTSRRYAGIVAVTLDEKKELLIKEYLDHGYVLYDYGIGRPNISTLCHDGGRFLCVYSSIVDLLAFRKLRSLQTNQNFVEFLQKEGLVLNIALVTTRKETDQTMHETWRRDILQSAALCYNEHVLQHREAYACTHPFVLTPACDVLPLDEQEKGASPPFQPPKNIVKL
ncbi:hypothetical protein HY641_02600 [Candidatus Woesearchaeota archaeon]|nr:hypothetical protein [Candidatus Woesearchaeota archaeon]